MVDLRSKLCISRNYGIFLNYISYEQYNYEKASSRGTETNSLMMTPLFEKINTNDAGVNTETFESEIEMAKKQVGYYSKLYQDAIGELNRSQAENIELQKNLKNEHFLVRFSSLLLKNTDVFFWYGVSGM